MLFTPADLGLRAWYDAELGQPKGVGYVQLDGTSGDYVYTPVSNNLLIAGDIEVVMRVKATDWTAAANQTLVGRYVTTGNQRSWRFYVSTAGAIVLTASADGTVVTSATITPTVALTDNVWIWLRMRLQLTNGANSVATLDIAADQAEEPTSWTANGSQTAAIIASVFGGTAPLEIGTFGQGTLERFTGQVSRCIVRNGFSGPVAADFDARQCYGPGYTHPSGYAWSLGLPKIYDRSGNGVAPATFGAGSNLPKWLPWKGLSGVYLPGSAGNYLSCPDAAALDIVGDLDIAVHATLDSWASGGNQALAGKWLSTGNQLSYQLRVNGSGTPLLLISTTGLGGGAVVTWTASAALVVPAGSDRWVRGTLDVDNGSGGSTARFYTSTDGVVWSQLGSDIVGVVAAPFSGSALLEIGSESGGTASLLAGTIHRVVIRNGIDGTTVADFVAASCGQSGYTDTLGNAWTVNRATAGRKAVVQSPVANSARSVILHGTDDYIDVPAAAIPPSTATDNLTYAVVHRGWNTPVAFGRVFSTQANSTSATAGIYLSNPTTTSTQWRAADGVSLAGAPSGTNFRNGIREMFAISIGSAGQTATVDQSATLTSVATGGIGDRTSTPARISGNNNGSAFQDFEFEALAIKAASTSDTERGQLTAYYRGGL